MKKFAVAPVPDAKVREGIFAQLLMAFELDDGQAKRAADKLMADVEFVKATAFSAKRLMEAALEEGWEPPKEALAMGVVVGAEE